MLRCKGILLNRFRRIYFKKKLLMALCLASQVLSKLEQVTIVIVYG
jgi:hypothetical protein